MHSKQNPFLKETTYQKAFFWNMMGSAMNAGASVIMLMVTTRVAGEVQGGIFSIGFAIASLMWTLASYETNTFHVTDGKQEYCNENFFHTKVLLCLLTLVVSIVYVLTRSYDNAKAMAAILLCLYKIIDAFSGFFYGAFQKAKRLDISGFSYFMRVLLSILLFCLGIALTKDLVVAVLLSCLMELIWILAYEIPKGRFLMSYRSRVQWKQIGRILIQCFPLFCASFILMYIVNIPKYAIDRLWTEEIQNAFSIIFMPAAVINLLGIFIFRPLLTTLVECWTKGNLKKLFVLCGRCFALVFVFTVVCVGAAYTIGIPVLEFLYGVPLAPYRGALLVVMVAGGFYACISFLYNILVVARKQQWILAAYVPTLLIALGIADTLVGQYEIMGASLVYLCSVGLIFILLTILIVVIMVQKRRAIR